MTARALRAIFLEYGLLPDLPPGDFASFVRSLEDEIFMYFMAYLTTMRVPV